jgi:hypothetical protein
MNESILYTIAKVAITLAGFSGVVVGLRLRGSHTWSPSELRILWFLVADSFLVMFFSLLPIPMALADWPQGIIWGICNALLGAWFFTGIALAIRGERKDSEGTASVFYVIMAAAVAMGFALWLSVFDLIVPRGQAIYVLGLIVLLAFASVEFLFFIGLMLRQDDKS